MADPTLGWNQFGTAIAAIGAFGTASFGLVESVGKAAVFSWISKDKRNKLDKDKDKSFHFGLPYAGFRIVKDMMAPLRPALKIAYGDDYLDIIAQQYIVDRVDGAAPDTIRQGVRLGLPFMEVTAGTDLIKALWGIEEDQSKALAQALQSPNNAPAAALPQPVDTSGAAALAGRFAAALDARVSAAFELADQRYENWAKTLAGVLAVALALALNSELPLDGTNGVDQKNILMAIGIGLVAVPLAPVAKDISSNLQNALTAFKSINGKS